MVIKGTRQAGRRFILTFMANATDVLNGVKAAIAALYPAIPVKVRKGQPGPGPESPLAGWTPADPNPCFIVSCQDPEPIDEFGSFEAICVKYILNISYVKPSQGLPGFLDDDPDTRNVRQNIRDNIYKPTLSGVGVVFGIQWREGPPYTDGNGVVTVSTDVGSFLTNEPRIF